jgi:hypothetical protein
MMLHNKHKSNKPTLLQTSSIATARMQMINIRVYHCQQWGAALSNVSFSKPQSHVSMAQHTYLLGTATLP